MTRLPFHQFFIERWLKNISGKLSFLTLSFIFIVMSLLLTFSGLKAAFSDLKIPTGSKLKINSNRLNVVGTVEIKGTLQTSTGVIGMTGDWDNSDPSGIYEANAGTVEFNGSAGLQKIYAVGIGTGKSFFNLTHAGTSTVRVEDTELNIDGSFAVTRSSGIFDVNGYDMTIGKDWTNYGTFQHRNRTVTLDGNGQGLVNGQRMFGTTTFYNLTKIISNVGSQTLVIDDNPSAEQIVARRLTLRGLDVDNRLEIRSPSSEQVDPPPSRGKIKLLPRGNQRLRFLDVKDSHASGLTLVATAALGSVDSGNNLNWEFQFATLMWDGTEDANWSNPNNWDLGMVPIAGDSVIIPGGVLQPIVDAGADLTIQLKTLTLESGGDPLASLTLNGHNLVVTETADNSGIINAQGSATVTIATLNNYEEGNINFKNVSNLSITAAVNNSGQIDFNGSTTVTMTTVNNANGGNMDFAPVTTLTITGTLNNSGTIHFNESGTITIATLSNTETGIIYLNGNEHIQIATPDTDSGTFYFEGDMDAGASVFTLSGDVPGYYHIIFSARDGNQDVFETSSDLNVFGNITFNAGTLNLSAGNAITTAGTISIDSGILNASGNVTVAHDLMISSAGIFTLLTDNTLSVSDTVSLSGDGILNASAGNMAIHHLIITAGTLTAPGDGHLFTVSGNFSTTESNQFIHNDGTVTLNGGNQSIFGNNIFYNLIKTTDTDVTLTLEAGKTQTILGNITLTGSPPADMDDVEHFLSVFSSANAATMITLVPGGTQFLRHLKVRYNTASGLPLITRRSFNLGHNINWFFEGVSILWQGDVSDNWDDPRNWETGLLPLGGDTAQIPQVSFPNLPPKLYSSPIYIKNLNIETGASLFLNGQEFIVDEVVSNEGTIELIGNEPTPSFGTYDVDSGRFSYVGNGDDQPDEFTIFDFGEVDYCDLSINDSTRRDVFIKQDDHALSIVHNLNVTIGTLDLSQNNNTLIIAEAGTLIVDGGTLIADEATLDVNGSVVISNGNFSAPGDGQSFTVAKDWTFLGGNFNPNNGRVIFDSSAETVFTGNTTFYNLRSYEYGKIFKFTPGSVQTVEGTFDFRGGPQVNQKISLLSVSEGDTWNIKFPYGEQGVQYLKVQDSNALENDITCFSCTNLLNNNEHWLFFALQMNVPAPNRTIDRTPTIIGFAESQTIVTIKGLVNGVLTPIAQTTSDVNGAFRVEATILLDVRADNYLIAFLGGTQGFTVLNLNVVENPTYQEVPTITSHVDGVRLFVDKPTFLGKGLENETVTVVASDIPAWGHLLLSTVGIATVDVNGDYSLMIDTPLPKGLNFISMTVNGVASDILEVKVASPHGVVFDSTTNQPINEAIVSLYRASDNQLATIADGDLDPTDVNPLITGEDGFYSFITADGNYYTRINAAGYDYPSTRTTFSVGRTIVTGSKAETFTSAGPMIIMDHPADANGLILRIEKEANKKEVKIGEVVTYTISIENKTPNLIKSVYLEDKIPPGFKYLQGRVKFNDVSIADPTGNRPLVFYLGDIPSKTKHKLQYQLVVGSGVTVGEYENVAFARYSNGQLLSNRATKIVRVVLDPLFDLGTVMGKVFFDKNENGIQDAPEYSYLDRDTYMEMPVPHARLVMEDGTVVKADETGRFSIPGIKPGRHVIRIDESSLPEGSYLTTDKAVIIDVTPGLMVKVNFGVNMDYNRFKSEDQQFFSQKVHLTQERSKPVARLHATLFNSPIAVYDNVFVNQAEFRIFMNYSAFIDKWRLEILDKDTRKLVKFFEGNRLNINDPIFWDGKILTGEYIDVTRQYVFLVYVENKEKYYDETILFPVSFNILEDEDALKKYQEDQKNQDLPKKYRDWVKNESQKSNIFVQTILVDGEKVVFNRLDRPIQSVRIMKEGALLMDVPLAQGYVLTAKDLLDGKMADDDRSQQQVDFILPKGDYEILVQEGEGTKAFISSENLDLPSSAERVAHTKEMVGSPSKIYTKQIRVGEDYLFFVGMGDAKIGYAVNTGDIEPVQQADKYKGGFYQEGQMAYYLKGKIQGKYLITSSFDTDREQKALFRKLNPDQYYPVYGDASSKDYQATDTQGPLYLLIEWDKSSAQWSNYNVAFEDTEFARFTRSLYGGKVNFESLSTTPYGESRSKVVAFHAQEKQRSAHNEFLATGGSLYYLKHKDIIEGSDKVRVEVRDKITGLVLSSSEMKEGADYEIDYASGRILFWQPVSMMVEAFSIISNDLLKGNLLYVVADYEYDVLEKYDEGSEGVRTRQAIGDHVLVGATYVSETQPTVNYELKGTDVTVHLGKDAKVIAEYAETRSNTIGTFLSTDGGLSFNELATSDDISGRAYGIKYDAKLFNRLGLDAYYKWIDNNFAVADKVSQQGKELIGFGGVYDFTEKSRLTLRHDIQRLVDDGNLQTRVQMGARQVSTTLMQIMHQANKLKLTGEYQRKQTELSVSNIIALKADYLVSDRLILSAVQQASVEGDKSAAQTTLGLTAKPTDKLTLTVQQILAREGAATLLGVKADMTGKFALTADYALEKSKKGLTQTTTTTTSVGMEMKPTEKSVIKTSVGLARANTGEVATTLAVKGISEIQKDTNVEGEIALAGAGATRRSTMALGGSTKLKVDEKTDVESQAKVTSSTDGIDGTSLNLTGTTKADATTTHQSGVTIAQDSAGVQTRTYNFATIKQLNEAFKVISAKSFGEKSDGTHIRDNTYSLVREKDGRKLEGSLKRAYEEGPKEISQSNIFGLSGDVNDKWAVTGSVERGTVQNLDGTQTQRSVASVALGYVNKDDEQGTFIKTSTKAEWRVDDGTEDKRQYLLYHALEGKIDNEWSVFSKLEFSKTRNLTRDTTDAQHKEIMLGGAYRPLSHDRLNLIARYTYKEERSPASQTDMAQIEYEDAHVFAMDAIYDLTQQWQLTEKFAYRIMDEKVKGFDFNKTHTWLMIHRLNYRINKDWSIGGEYRVLTQEESADAKTGILLEVTRRIGDYGQLGVGYDFTSFADDLTDLSYKSQGPFMRMTGKFYDRKPEELERAKEKWLEEKIHRWAWVMVEQEFKKKKSPLMQELNEYFILAQKARHKGDWEESQQIYKDIIMAGEMMFQEAVEYIRARVKREERFKEMQSLADQYFKTGQYEKARKILEKILEEARDTMVE